jgi:hypothetical protein
MRRVRIRRLIQVLGRWKIRGKHCQLTTIHACLPVITSQICRKESGHRFTFSGPECDQLSSSSPPTARRTQSHSCAYDNNFFSGYTRCSHATLVSDNSKRRDSDCSRTEYASLIKVSPSDVAFHSCFSHMSLLPQLQVTPRAYPSLEGCARGVRSKIAVRFVESTPHASPAPRFPTACERARKDARPLRADPGAA